MTIESKERGLDDAGSGREGEERNSSRVRWKEVGASDTPRPRKCVKMACAKSICPLRIMQPHPASVVRLVPANGGKSCHRGEDIQQQERLGLGILCDT